MSSYAPSSICFHICCFYYDFCLSNYSFLNMITVCILYSMYLTLICIIIPYNNMSDEEILSTNKLQHLLKCYSLLTWLAFTFKNNHKICSNKYLLLMVTLNLLTLLQCYNNPVNVIIVSGLLHYVLNCTRMNRQLEYLIGLVVVAIEPGFGSICVIAKIWSWTKQQENQIVKQKKQNRAGQRQRQGQSHAFNFKVLFQRVSILAFVCVCFVSILINQNDRYFSNEFDKNSGVTWLLYSHIFQRYLKLYQLILPLCNFFLIYPLTWLQCPQSTKLAISWFFCCFTSPEISPIHIWGLYYLESRAYSQQFKQLKQKNKQIILNTISIIMLVITIPTYLFYERLIYIWHNTHMISIGYFLVQILLFWGTHAVYLSQLLIINDDNEGKEAEEQSKLQKLTKFIKKYIKQRFEQM